MTTVLYWQPWQRGLWAVKAAETAIMVVVVNRESPSLRAHQGGLNDVVILAAAL